jgi:hypothetical protein
LKLGRPTRKGLISALSLAKEENRGEVNALRKRC